MLTRTLGPQREWVVRSRIGWRGERNIPYKGRLGLLQIVSESDTRCVSEDIGPPNRVGCEIPYRLERGTKHSRIKVGLGCYKWYQSKTPTGVPARTLDPKGGGL